MTILRFFGGPLDGHVEQRPVPGEHWDKVAVVMISDTSYRRSAFYLEPLVENPTRANAVIEFSHDPDMSLKPGEIGRVITKTNQQ